MVMKSNSDKQLIQFPAFDEASLLRMVFINEDVITEEENTFLEKEITTLKNKTRTKLFVKEPLPLFDDYKFKYKDHDPL
jgi:hypothetical protein